MVDEPVNGVGVAGICVGTSEYLYLYGMSCIGKHESVLYIIAPPQLSEW
jgi:hypothetical protein